MPRRNEKISIYAVSITVLLSINRTIGVSFNAFNTWILSHWRDWSRVVKSTLVDVNPNRFSSWPLDLVRYPFFSFFLQIDITVKAVNDSFKLHFIDLPFYFQLKLPFVRFASLKSLTIPMDLTGKKTIGLYVLTHVSGSSETFHVTSRD